MAIFTTVENGGMHAARSTGKLSVMAVLAALRESLMTDLYHGPGLGAMTVIALGRKVGMLGVVIDSMAVTTVFGGNLWVWLLTCQCGGGEENR